MRLKIILFFMAIIFIFTFITGDESMGFGSMTEDALLNMKISNVRDFEAWGDGTYDDYAAINAAHTATTANGGTVFFPPGTYKLSSGLTINANVTLDFSPGAKLSIDSGKTITINGHIADTIHQIFSGDGSVAGEPRNDFVRPEWWGAVPDGSTDCAAALETAINFAYSGKVGAVKLSAGIYICESAKTFTNVREVTIFGTTVKPQYTTSRTAGSAIVFKDIATDTPGWKFVTCRGLTFKDFWMYTSGTKAHSGIYLDQTATSVFEGVNIQGFTVSSVYLDDSFSLTFKDCTFAQSDAGVRSEGSCQNITFLGCSLIQNTTCGAWVYGQNYTFIGIDFEGQPRAIDQNSAVGRVNSTGWVIEGCYFESMTSTDIMRLVFNDYAQLGTGYLSDTSYKIYLNSCDHSVVVNWPGAVHVQSASTHTTIVHAAGTITDDASDTVVLEDIYNDHLKKDGSIALTDDWKAGTKGLQIADLGVSKTGSSYGDDAVSNGAFTSDTTGWTAVVCTLSSEAGGQSGNCLKILNAEGGGGYNAQARQEITVIPFLRYKISAYFKKGTGARGRIYLDSTEFSRSPASGDLYDSGNISDADWTEYTGEFVPTVSTIYLMLESYEPGDTSYFDEVTIKPIIAGDLAVGNDINVLGGINVGNDISAAGGFKQGYSFYQSSVAASQTNIQIDILGLSGNTEILLPYAGSVLAIAVASNDARTAGTLTVDATINGTATGLQAVLDASNTTYHCATQAKDSDTFSAGDRLGVEITTDGSWAPTTANIVVSVTIEM